MSLNSLGYEMIGSNESNIAGLASLLSKDQLIEAEIDQNGASIPICLFPHYAKIESVKLLALAESHDASVHNLKANCSIDGNDLIDSDKSLNTANGWQADALFDLGVNQNLDVKPNSVLKLDIENENGTTATITGLLVCVKFRHPLSEFKK